MFIWMISAGFVHADGMYNIPYPEFFTSKKAAEERLRELEDAPSDDEWCSFSYTLDRLDVCKDGIMYSQEGEQ